MLSARLKKPLWPRWNRLPVTGLRAVWALAVLWFELFHSAGECQWPEVTSGGNQVCTDTYGHTCELMLDLRGFMRMAIPILCMS